MIKNLKKNLKKKTDQKKMGLFLLLSTVILGGGVWMETSKRQSSKDFEKALGEQRIQSLERRSRQGDSANIPREEVKKISFRGGVLAPDQRDEVLRGLQEKLGKDLRAQFTGDQRLVRLEGEIGQGREAADGFDPGQESEVRARAQAILSQAQGLIGFSSDSPIELKKVNPGQVTAQVFYKQKFQGLPIEPEGNLKVDLGPHGELIAFYSSYVSQLQIQNQRKLSPEEIIQTLKAFLNTHSKKGVHVENLQSEKILWVEGQVAYYADQFIVFGMKIILNSESGDILFFKEVKHS